MFKNILRAKTRSALTVTAIAVGVFAVVLISAAGAAGSEQVSETLKTMGIDSILVQHENNYAPPALDKDDIQAINRISGVKKAMPLMASVNKTKLLDESINCFTWGVNMDAKEIISLEAKHGRLITAGDIKGKSMVCVIDEDIAVTAYGRSNVVGKTVRVVLGGAEYEFEIVGVAKSGISSLQSALSGIVPNFIYLPIDTMQMLTGKSGYDKIAVLTRTDGDFNGFDSSGIIDSINGIILQNKGENSGLVVLNLLSQKKALLDILTTVTTVLSVIAGISLLVSGLTIMTTMLVSVNERKREIGIKKSIGAKNSDIAKEFLSESLTLSAIGSAIGAGMGIAAAAIGCAVLNVKFSIDITSVLTAVLFSLGIGAVFGVYPALKAAKLEPIEALRHN